MQIIRTIGAILSIAAVLGCLSLAQPAAARATQVASLRESVVPIVVMIAYLSIARKLGAFEHL